MYFIEPELQKIKRQAYFKENLIRRHENPHNKYY